MIHIQNVTKSFDCYDVLSNVSFDIRGGELVALLGPNGAGKSTLINCILGITGYDGKITVDGLDPLRDGPKLRGRIGFMPQQGSLHSDLTLVETIDFYAAFRNVDADAMELLAAVQLSDHADNKVGELSGGMQQRLAFAIARIGHPPVLLLDEPSASLDRESRTIMFTLLRQLVDDGVSVLLSTHLHNELAECADRFVILENGRVIEQRTRSAA